MSDDDVVTAYERTAAGSNSSEAPTILAEVQHCGIAAASTLTTSEYELIDRLATLPDDGDALALMIARV